MDDDTELRFSPTAFQRSHVPEDVDAELAALLFVLDLQAGLPSVLRLRDWVLAALAPRPGETAVDVGSGTGSEVVRLAELVGPTGRAVGVEPQPALRDEAVRRAAGSGAEFVDGDALALPFDDGSVDVLRCERVWQHLAEPQRAAQEVARVLAPGGRAAVVDSDWATAVVRPGDPDVHRRLNEAMRRRTPNPFAGRNLRVQLQAAGLVVDADIGSTALVMPDEFLAQPVMLRISTDLAVEESVLVRPRDHH
jgi:SAM-dependent methyltransferase